MAQSYKFLRVSTTVFKVLAWVAVAFQVVTGMILIIQGGSPCPSATWRCRSASSGC